jgi:hypothetical protein
MLTFACFLFINATTLYFNGIWRLAGPKSYRAYQVGRTASLPLRLLVIWLATENLLGMMDMLMVGMGIEALMGVLTFGFGFLDLRHDAMALFGKFMGSKFVVIEELPGNIFVCQRKAKMNVGPSKAMWPEHLVGPELRSKPGLTLICLCEGLVLELKEMKLRDWESLRGSYRSYQTKTFNSTAKNYTLLKQQMLRDQIEKEAIEKVAARNKHLQELAEARAEARAAAEGGLPGQAAPAARS